MDDPNLRQDELFLIEATHDGVGWHLLASCLESWTTNNSWETLICHENSR
jgi:hypothetical protein